MTSKFWDVEKENEIDEFNYNFYDKPFTKANNKNKESNTLSETTHSSNTTHNSNTTHSSNTTLSDARSHYVKLTKSTKLLEKSRDFIRNKTLKKINRNDYLNNLEMNHVNESDDEGSGSNEIDDEESGINESDGGSNKSDDGSTSHSHVDNDENTIHNAIHSDYDSESDGIHSDYDSESDGNDKSNNQNEKSNLLTRQEDDEQELLKSLKNAQESDKEKGRVIRKQLEFWNFLLDTRIKVQKSLEHANAIPAPRYGYHALVENDVELNQDISTISSSLVGIFDRLTSMQLKLISSDLLSEKEKKKLSKKRSHQDMQDWLNTTFENVIKPMENALEPYRVATVEKWNEKVQASSGLVMQKKFKVINQNFTTIYQQLNQDKDRLMKRTRLNRGNITIIGKPTKNESSTIPISDDQTDPIVLDKRLQDYDDSIYNDDDFYQQILKEFIDSRLSDANDSSALGVKYAQLRQLQGKKNKKKVDTRASKGRKIRYHVHEKIQNFMAPEPYNLSEWHEEKSRELFSSLFGQKSTTAHTHAGADMESEEILVTDGFKLF